ncbi:guanine nucleotide-binding protein g(o) subunit alpha [Anaeramoeba flamelloides]|uniref:Guanine nucleotide-binding protein g(O) subunit alpha n=1 Tax=Anaeramoeba flamelloides TaxID=1746091 RepID=A0AAV7YYD0_9EUKA|nr:guanine nucleotide-binding protein g(o) subunit alpha [Anaeramoeba flamelloides]
MLFKSQYEILSKNDEDLLSRDGLEKWKKNIYVKYVNYTLELVQIGRKQHLYSSRKTQSLIKKLVKKKQKLTYDEISKDLFENCFSLWKDLKFQTVFNYIDDLKIIDFFREFQRFINNFTSEDYELTQIQKIKHRQSTKKESIWQIYYPFGSIK